MANYQLTENGSVIRAADGACVPPDPANRDYADYLAWLANGNAPDPHVPPPPPVPAISQAQAILSLVMAGKTEAVVKAEVAKIKDHHARAVIEAML